MQCNPTRFLIGLRVPHPFLSFLLSLMLRVLEAPKLMDITERSFFSVEKIRQNTTLPCRGCPISYLRGYPGPPRFTNQITVPQYSTIATEGPGGWDLLEVPPIRRDGFGLVPFLVAFFCPLVRVRSVAREFRGLGLVRLRLWLGGRHAGTPLCGTFFQNVSLVCADWDN